MSKVYFIISKGGYGDLSFPIHILENNIWYFLAVPKIVDVNDSIYVKNSFKFELFDWID
jgi:hypothetical protein